MKKISLIKNIIGAAITGLLAMGTLFSGVGASVANAEKIPPAELSSYSHSSMFDGYDIINGIDVSQWNGDIDWEKVKASGVDYAFIRVGGRYTSTGTYFKDSKYKENIEGAQKAGIDVGVYFFSCAINASEAKAEANYTMNLIKDYSISLPVVIDYEYAYDSVTKKLTGRLYNAHLTKSQANSVVKAFCSTVEAKGYVGMLYASKSVLVSDMNGDLLAKYYPIWSAQYNTADTLSSFHSYWQYSSTGKVDGIAGDTDMNFRYVKSPSKVNTPTYEATDTTITLTWTKIPEVYGYQIVRYDEAQAKYVTAGYCKGAATTTFADNALADGTVYKYRVRAFYKLENGNKWGEYSEEANACTLSDQVKNLKVIEKKKNSVSLSWTTQANVSGYCIYRAPGTSGNYELVETINTPETGTYKDTNVTPGRRYSYRVQSFTAIPGSNSVFHKQSARVVATTTPGQVTGLAVEGSTSTSVTIHWNKQLNVLGYKIYVWNAKKNTWSHIASVSKKKNSYTHTKLSTGKEYKYRVRCYYKSNGKKFNCTPSDPVIAFTGLDGVKSLRQTSSKTASVNIVWKSVKAATGYRVYVLNETTNNYDLYKTVTGRKISMPGLTAGKKYTVKVVPYITVASGTYEGSPTSIKVYTKPVCVTNVQSAILGDYTYLRWEKAENADGYYIYSFDSKGGSKKLVQTVKGGSKTACLLPKLADGYNYKIVTYVSASEKIYKSAYSAAPASYTGEISGVITGDYVNVRKKAGTTYDIVTVATAGTKVTVIGAKEAENILWYKITFSDNGKNVTGYMSSDYVKLQ